VSVLWGIPYLLIKIAVDDGVPPAFVAWVRVVLGAAVLIWLAWRAGALGGLRGRTMWLAAFAVAEIALPFPLIAAGEQHVISSIAAILIATVPASSRCWRCASTPLNGPAVDNWSGSSSAWREWLRS